MATSGSKDWALTRDNIIDAALRKIGAYDSGQTTGSAEVSDAAETLNAIVKEWASEGIGLWMRRTCTLILNPNKQRYHLGPNGTPGTVDDFHCFYDTELIEATGDAIEPAAETSISVDAWVDYAGNSASNPAGSDVVGVRLASGSMHWSTVSSATSTTVVLDDALPSATEVGSKVYTYTNRITRPVHLLYAYRRDTSGNDAEIEIVGRKEYERLSLKSSDGVPTACHFDPQLDDAVLHVWPVDNPKSTDKLHLVLRFYMDDFDASGNNPELPVEWTNALVWNLAAELSFEYGTDPATRSQVFRIAEQKKQALFSSDTENASFEFVPWNTP